MPQLGNYFIDATTLAGATAVFVDAGLTTVAGNGYYSDGTIVRLQTNGLLGAVNPCPACGLNCNVAVSESNYSGLYQVAFQGGALAGCLIIYFKPGNQPDGFLVEYDGNESSFVISENFGYLEESNDQNYNFLGDQAQDCGIAVQLGQGGYSGLIQLVYSGNGFVLAGNNGTVTGAAGDVNLTNGDPGWCTHFFPYTPAQQSFVLNIASVCAGAIFDIEANCPVVLTGIETGLIGQNCVDNFPNTFYNIPNRNGVAGEPALHEFVSTDSSGEFFPPSGTYTMNPPSGKKQVTIQNDATTGSYAIITNIVNCP